MNILSTIYQVLPYASHGSTNIMKQGPK